MTLKHAFKAISLLAIATTLSAEADDDYLNYAIPPNAVKIGPSPSRDPKRKVYTYCPAGQTPNLDKALAYETYRDGHLIERKLVKNLKPHGVQRLWYENGTLKSEAPYKNGVMHGTFRQWDEAGQLVAQYEMINGNGTEKAYNSAGELILEQVTENGVGNGVFMEVTDNGGTRILSSVRDGKAVGKRFRFYSTGNVSGIMFRSTEGVPHGPQVSFYKDGRAVPYEWYVDGKKVNEMEYAAAAASDPTLPPYYADTKKYKEFVDEEVKARLEKYQKMPKVKIPLEFDQAGNPVPAR